MRCALVGGTRLVKAPLSFIQLLLVLSSKANSRYPLLSYLGAAAFMNNRHAPPNIFWLLMAGVNGQLPRVDRLHMFLHSTAEGLRTTPDIGAIGCVNTAYPASLIL